MKATSSMGFRKDIQDVINRHSAERESNTPDFILATYLAACLAAFDAAVNEREQWYGHKPAQIPSTQLGQVEIIAPERSS